MVIVTIIIIITVITVIFMVVIIVEILKIIVVITINMIIVLISHYKLWLASSSARVNSLDIPFDIVWRQKLASVILGIFWVYYGILYIMRIL